VLPGKKREVLAWADDRDRDPAVCRSAMLELVAAVSSYTGQRRRQLCIPTDGRGTIGLRVR